MPRQYTNQGLAMLTMLFNMKGSCIPKASIAASLSAIICILLNLLRLGYFGSKIKNYMEAQLDVFLHPFGCQIFSMLLGYVVVFRTNMALSRYWEGATNIVTMFSKWNDAFSLMHSFIAASRTNPCPKDISHVLAHWYSLMGALAVIRLRIEDDGRRIPPVRHLSNFMPNKETDKRTDFAGKDLSKEQDWFLGTLMEISVEEIDQLNLVSEKVIVVARWITQSVEVFRMRGWIVCPEPILSRAFQELSNGLTGYYQAAKLCEIPFPFPFMQLILVLLVVDTLLLPFVITQFTREPISSVCLTFFVVLGYWGLFFICMELEDPYGEDYNDLPLVEMHREFCAVLAQNNASHLPNAYVKSFGLADAAETELKEEGADGETSSRNGSSQYLFSMDSIAVNYRLGGAPVHESLSDPGISAYTWK